VPTGTASAAADAGVGTAAEVQDAAARARGSPTPMSGRSSRDGWRYSGLGGMLWSWDASVDPGALYLVILSWPTIPNPRTWPVGTGPSYGRQYVHYSIRGGVRYRGTVPCAILMLLMDCRRLPAPTSDPSAVAGRYVPGPASEYRGRSVPYACAGRLRPFRHTSTHARADRACDPRQRRHAAASRRNLVRAPDRGRVAARHTNVGERAFAARRHRHTGPSRATANRAPGRDDTDDRAGRRHRPLLARSIHPLAHLAADFQPALGIRDDDRSYPLPPGLGGFALHRGTLSRGFPPAGTYTAA
jgi:hypothetical protein